MELRSGLDTEIQETNPYPSMHSCTRTHAYRDSPTPVPYYSKIRTHTRTHLRSAIVPGSKPKSPACAVCAGAERRQGDVAGPGVGRAGLGREGWAAEGGG